ncbi:MAG TPA: hypothetical protein VL133_13305 [Devosia sp.]|nr:hypothetical protein [Devosia sp.]
MTVRVITGPAPIVTPADVPGGHAADDAQITALIAAVQAGIDGPTGWLGRALGEQTLELTRAGFHRSIRLPYLPVSEIVGVKYRDADGVEQTVDIAGYRRAADTAVFAPSFAFPATQCSDDAVTIQYKAGYAANAVPASAKQAVILGVQHLSAMTSDQNLYLRSEEVEGVGTFTYTVSEAAGLVVKAATEMLLGPLRVYWL